jgi:hypothetical protein
LDEAVLFEDALKLDAAVAALRSMPPAEGAVTIGREAAAAQAIEAATARLARYEMRGRIQDLDAALDVLSDVTSRGTSDRALLARASNNVGVAYECRYRTWGRDEDLEAALDCIGDAGALAGASSPDADVWLEVAVRCNLAAATQARYQRTGQMEDLDLASRWASAAVQLVGEPDVERQHVVLAGGLHVRPLLLATTIRRPADGDPASKLLTLVADLVVKAALFLTAAGLHHDRFRHTRRLADLDPGIDLMREFAGSLPPHASFSIVVASELGRWLRSRYEVSGERADLEQAITLSERAHRASSLGRPGRVRRLQSLGEALVLRYEADFAAADGDRGVAVLATALEEGDREAPERAAILRWMARVSAARFIGRRDDLDRTTATGRFREACALGLERSPSDALHTARDWGAYASLREAWDEAREAYGQGLAAIDELLRRQLLRESKVTWLRAAQGLAAEAAYALARANDLAGAVLALERARGRLLAETQVRRAVTLRGLLENEHGDLANRYWAELAEVERLELGLQPGGDLTSLIATARERLRTVADEIEALHGHRDAFAPLDMAQIHEAAGDGTLVYVVSALAGGLALIVHRRDIDAVWLDLDRRTADRALGVADGVQPGGYLAAIDNPSAFPAALDDLLVQLGTRVMTPLLNRLGSGRETVVLIPVGRLAVAPLHAAWCAPRGREACWALECRPFVYAPSAAARVAALRSADVPGIASGLLAVGDPRSDRAPRLARARAEVEAIAELLGAEPLVDASATFATVWDRLQRVKIAHFACHGRFVVEDPLASSLLLSGTDQLTARQLVEASPETLGSVRLAVMSACRTSLSDWRMLPDEVVGLTSSFLQTGIPAVVGTLWAVDDTSSATLMEALYERMHVNGASVADALRAAQLEQARGTLTTGTSVRRDLRAGAKSSDVASTHPYHWAGFVISGAADVVCPIAASVAESR